MKMSKLLILTVLFLFDASADDMRTPLTRWQAVRFSRFEDSTLFRIDVLDLMDNNPPRSDANGLGFPDGGSESSQTLAQMLQNFTKRGVDSSAKKSQQLDGNLFASEKSEGTVRLWGRDIMWHRYSFLVSEGSFEMKFTATNAVVRASGTVNRNSSGQPRLERIAFHKEYKAESDKWKSWGFDRRDDIGENSDYIICGCYSVR